MIFSIAADAQPKKKLDAQPKKKFEWKISRITPLPKCCPAKTVENDIRPIAITNSIAKIAESLLGRLFNEH